MNLAYFRKSVFDMETTVKNLKDNLSKHRFIIQSDLKQDDNITVIIAVNEVWLKTILAEDKNLIGLIPNAFTLIKDKADVYVGVGNPEILSSVSRNPVITKISAEAVLTIKELINATAGVGELKASNVKLYSTATCPYCTMEKDWLEKNKIEHNVIYVDKDQSAAQEMVQKTGQMGVPVTEVVYEDGDSEMIIGFDKARLGLILGVKN